MLRNIILCLAVIFALPGCIPAALVVGATVGGAIVYDKRSLKTMRQDQQITHKIVKAIKADPNLSKHALVTVSTVDHMVLLTGRVQTPERRDRVYRIAEKTPNVTRVYNGVVVGKPISRFVQTKDAWITTKAKMALLAKPGLSSNDIKVVTTDQVLYLMGVVNRRQADLATEVVRNISGLKKVVKVFEYA